MVALSLKFELTGTFDPAATYERMYNRRVLPDLEPLKEAKGIGVGIDGNFTTPTRAIERLEKAPQREGLQIPAKLEVRGVASDVAFDMKKALDASLATLKANVPRKTGAPRLAH
ncbi:hypothetical protein [Erythrobacter dokdonensis]|uniref:Uncharacterized protein n=1 Tax=Erythrobacter dokdonensis DSW-74 TaxID=1300349 RepID=A0A1A7BK57_9SPHN|nr:hypothetical protein [Erythrobacter dokdonensis]OBV11565.1 hypothetical protein I603_1008 [Erythrobacter dokdonensis DSW-74]